MVRRVGRRRAVWEVGAIAATLATVGTVLIYALATLQQVSFRMPLQPGAEPAQLPVGMVIVTSLAAAGLAAITFSFARRFPRRGLRAFQIAGAAFLLLSLSAPLGLQGADTPTKTALVLMHIVAGVSILAVFGRVGMARQ